MNSINLLVNVITKLDCHRKNGYTLLSILNTWYSELIMINMKPNRNDKYSW